MKVFISYIPALNLSRAVAPDKTDNPSLTACPLPTTLKLTQHALRENECDGRPAEEGHGLPGSLERGHVRLDVIDQEIHVVHSVPFTGVHTLPTHSAHTWE